MSKPESYAVLMPIADELFVELVLKGLEIRDSNLLKFKNN